MRKKIRILVLSIMISVLMVSNVFASQYSYNPNDYTSVDVKSDLLPSSVRFSRVYMTPERRGSFFSGADLIIKDNGNGNIGAFAKAYMDHPVDEVYITIYLDRWDAEAERWRQVTFHDEEFYAKDFPNGLTDPVVDITFLNLEKGYSYRLRGVFAAVYNDVFEGFSPVTDGILIE